METSIAKYLGNMDILIAVAYLSLSIKYLHSFFTGRSLKGGWFLAFLPSVAAVHFVKLLIQGISEGHCPLVGVHEMLSFTAFSVAVIYLILERSQRYYSTGALFMGVVFILQAGSALTQTSVPELTGVPVGLHAPIALIAMASFATSAVYGVIYLILHAFLKAGRFGANLKEVPSLESIERMQTISSAIGVLLLAVAIASGLVIGMIYGHDFDVRDPKVIASLGLLLIFGYGVVGGWRFSFSGRKKSIISIAGVAAAVISISIVRFIIPTFHKF